MRVLSMLQGCVLAGLFVLLGGCITRALRDGDRRTALGIGLMGLGVAAGILPAQLRIFGGSPDHWGYWLLLAVGIAALFAGCKIVYSIRRPPA